MGWVISARLTVPGTRRCEESLQLANSLLKPSVQTPPAGIHYGCRKHRELRRDTRHLSLQRSLQARIEFPLMSPRRHQIWLNR